VIRRGITLFTPNPSRKWVTGLSPNKKMRKTIEPMQGGKADGSVKKKYKEKLARR